MRIHGRSAPPLAYLLASAISVAMMSCGGGGTEPNTPPAASLTIIPDSLRLLVGDRGSLIADVRDTARALMSVAVRWTSLDSNIAKVDQGGTVTGVSQGSTEVIAFAAPVADTVPVHVLAPAATGPCDGIQWVSSWDVSFSYSYAADTINSVRNRATVQHSADFTAHLTPFGGLPAIHWEGRIAGTGSMQDSYWHLDATPPAVETLNGNGPLVPGPLSEFTLTFDPSACTYTFRVGPFLMTTFTDVTGRTWPPGPAGIGIVQGTEDLGDWRASGLSNHAGGYDAYVSPAVAAFRSKRFYVPGGFGLNLWGNPEATYPIRAAAVQYTIRPDTASSAVSSAP